MYILCITWEGSFLVKSNDAIDYDGNWKRIIHSLFEEFVLFFAEDLYEIIDWSNQPEGLNKEIAKIKPENKVINRKADNLYKVYLKDGKEKWILIHLEVQGYDDTDFAKRMFQYFYRIYDRYDKEVYALTLFTDDLAEKYTPAKFTYGFLGTKLNYSYHTYKIAEQNEEELINSNNPFSYVILAAKKAITVKNSDVETKYELKKQLLGILSNVKHNDNLANNYVAAMLLFMDNIIKLSSEYEEIFKQDVNNWEGGIMITYEKEIENKAMIKVAKKLIRIGIPMENIIEATNLPEEKIKELQEKESNK